MRVVLYNCSDSEGLMYLKAVTAGLLQTEEPESRDALAKELNLRNRPGDGEAQAPLLMQLLHAHRNGGSAHHSNNSKSSAASHNLTKQQIEDARKKFEDYDRDGSGAIDKDELRELFMDMFPSFNKNMLERYVNDEFRAVDRNFSSSIDFDEFLGMYKRLFLQCRSVVSQEVEDLVSPAHKSSAQSAPPSLKIGTSVNSVEARNQRNLEKSAPPLPSTPPPKSIGSPNGSQGNVMDDLLGGGDDDSFFDDILPSAGGLHTFPSSPSPKERAASPDSKNRPSQIPVRAGLRR